MSERSLIVTFFMSKSVRHDVRTRKGPTYDFSDQACSMLDPVQKSSLMVDDPIRSGLSSVHAGIADSRARIEELVRKQDVERAALVDTRYRLRAEASSIERALSGRSRVLAAGETSGPRARERDGAPLPTEEAPRPSPLPVVATQAPRDWTEETERSLAAYGLTRAGTPRGLDETEAWRRILRRT
jgi:hypothetical protein